MMDDRVGHLLSLFGSAVEAALPNRTMQDFLPQPPKGKTVVIGAGKAAALMAQTLELIWPGELSGCVVTRYGHSVATHRITVLEASHPVPDKASIRSAQVMRGLVQGLTKDDLVIALISGGASSLMVEPIQGLYLDQKQAIHRDLLRSGAKISEMNVVRKQLSGIKGGRLARACYPAPVVNLIISDVPGDDPSLIGSGPTVADDSTPEQALEILFRYGLVSHLDAIRLLQESVHRPAIEVPLPLIHTHIIASPQIALEAAALQARKLGYQPLILSDSVEGEAREVALVHAAIAQQVIRNSQPLVSPCVLLSGGETTVTVKGQGRGGRNAEFLLSLGLALGPQKRVYALAADTDGVDGTEDNAGAWWTPETWDRAKSMGLNLRQFLDNNDGYGFFEAVGQLHKTGPTLTNVNDFRAIIITEF